MKVTRVKWTDEELELLDRVWPEMGIACAPMFPRHEPSATAKKASVRRLKYNRPQTPAELIVEMSKREHGVGTGDFPEKQKLFYYLTDQKRLFTSDKRLGRHAKRFFDTKERAEAYYAEWEPPALPATNAKPKGSGLRKVGSAGRPIPKPTTGGPARIPGEPDFSRAKWTYGKKPPEQTYHSNTHSHWG